MRDPDRPARDRDSNPDSRRIVVVGPCASGKSTVVAALRERGYDARACGQEHSIISSLWRHSNPDIVIALEADIETVRARRGDAFPAWLHALELERLTEARASADLSIDTGITGASTMVETIVAFLQRSAKSRG